MVAKSLLLRLAAALRALAFALVATLMLTQVPTAAASNGDGPVVHTVLDIDAPLQPGEYLWEPEGAPAGRLEIVIDVAVERIYVYRGGVEIGRSLIIYGSDEKPTPLGTFKILEKDIDHVSNIYNAPMPYMLRLTWGGVAIHGSGIDVDNRWATHGCVGVPDEFAALIYAQARLGDRVTVTRHWMTDVYHTP